MEQKKFVKVGLSVENFRAYVGMIEDEVEQFMKTDSAFLISQMNDINEWGRFDVTDIMAQITILTASRTLQGSEVRQGLDKSFSELFNALDGGFTPLNFLFPNLPLESYRKRDEAHKKMSEFYVDIIRKRRESGIVSPDFRVFDFVLTFVTGCAGYDFRAHLSEVSEWQRTPRPRDRPYPDCSSHGGPTHEFSYWFLVSPSPRRQPGITVSTPSLSFLLSIYRLVQGGILPRTGEKLRQS